MPMHQIRLSPSDYQEACDCYEGYCMSCNDITNDSGVEPDAEGYKCCDCGENAVMGIENALMAGHIVFDEDDSESENEGW